jgi:hypothetical protein
MKAFIIGNAKNSPNFFINHQKVASVLPKTEHQWMIEIDTFFLALSQSCFEREQKVLLAAGVRGLLQAVLMEFL